MSEEYQGVPPGERSADASRAPHEAAEALRGLTPTQRIYVRDGSLHGDITMRTVRPLLRKGMFYIHINSPNGQCGDGRLTPLGEAVRALMLAGATTPSSKGTV